MIRSKHFEQSSLIPQMGLWKAMACSHLAAIIWAMSAACLPRIPPHKVEGKTFCCHSYAKWPNRALLHMMYGIHINVISFLSMGNKSFWHPVLATWPNARIEIWLANERIHLQFRSTYEPMVQKLSQEGLEAQLFSNHPPPVRRCAFFCQQHSWGTHRWAKATRLDKFFFKASWITSSTGSEGICSLFASKTWFHWSEAKARASSWW